ncbi:hypothetical protein A2U01_0005594 [Trifolium medium]|uniref:Uncharacterized protein n=1 Tax=Trifolium medium TaxID=97028 RepID=A0A392MDB4_9FABA|nr:hypothetical protein [Trifolium medium]
MAADYTPSKVEDSSKLRFRRRFKGMKRNQRVFEDELDRLDEIQDDYEEAYYTLYEYANEDMTILRQIQTFSSVS